MAKKDFHHPFQPYDIQHQFMEAMYQCIEEAKVGIFESPTGTGKSLSLICASLTWLREHKRNAFDEAVAAIEVDDDEPAWMAEHARRAKSRELRQMRADFETRLQAVREREQKVRDRNANPEPDRKRRRLDVQKDGDGESELDRFILDDYDSDDGHPSAKSVTSGYSSETSKLMKKLGMSESKKPDIQHEEVDELKVFFCSRTHSQLSQFVGELKRVSMPPGLPQDTQSDSDGKALEIEQVKQLSLGARKTLCLNPKVAKLGNPTAINERCLELQQPSTPSDLKCPFLPNKENEDVALDFRDHALARIRDIEDLASVGAKLGICPYYASRPAIGPAEMVTLPYPLLLQKSARDALGISLKGHVVIIDEAHNLMNAIEGMYSAHVTNAQLTRAREAIMVYLQKFRNRLKGGNRIYVTQFVRVIDSLLGFMATIKDDTVDRGIVEAGSLLSGKAVDQINLAKLVRYIGDSKLARKVEGYAAHAAKAQIEVGSKTTAEAATKDVPNLTHVQNFLITLMNPSKEGRFFWSWEGGSTTLRYLLLDPSEHFRDIVQEARAVILAGGTMSPMDDYKQQLFPYLQELKTFSCGHLIPPSSLLVRAIDADDEGRVEFSYKSRNAFSAVRVGRALRRLAPHVTGGLVVFFPSYGFLELVTECWRSQGIISQLEELKPVFCDSRGGSAEDTFKAYSNAISTGRSGAILLSVIGGKLSEGINFSDDLGRCVVVVGLPFPNLETPEWKAKMQYLDDRAVSSGEARGKAGREHVENVCMRSVNQAIGRVIRHKDDWASIILMDSRYTQERIRAKLPGWMKESFSSQASSDVEAVTKHVEAFFTGRTARPI